VPIADANTGETVLVVDDNAHNRALAEAHLTAAGYAVQLADGGEQALEMFAEHAPDLVLLDVVMPRMDGFETCSQIRKLQRGADTPIVFLTALTDVSSHQRAMESGVDDFLTKPINRTELLLRVRSLLRIKRLNDDLKEGFELIRSQRDALIRVQRQREELMQHVVHDLKNPLGAIEMNARYLLDSLPSEDLRDATRDIVEGSTSLRRMVMNLLDICRSEDGQLVPALSNVDLGTLVKSVIGEHARESKERDVELKSSVHLDDRIVQADRDLVRRVLENLIVNAIRHSPRASQIDVTASASEDDVELSVRDLGEGVPEAFREKVFDKYVRLDSDVAALANRGLGLTFCRIAVEAHGGRVWVEPNKPNGAAFIFRLPRRASAQPIFRSDA
jgi:two-component system sensor histidine kinase/response regulator